MYEFMTLVEERFKGCEMKGRVGTYPRVLSMTDRGSKDTYGRNEPDSGIGFEFISQL